MLAKWLSGFRHPVMHRAICFTSAITESSDLSSLVLEGVGSFFVDRGGRVKICDRSGFLDNDKAKGPMGASSVLQNSRSRRATGIKKPSFTQRLLFYLSSTDARVFFLISHLRHIRIKN